MQSTLTMNFNFVFIIPSYNNKDWYKNNIKSISKQVYNNWRAIYVDDHSTDHTLDLVRQYVKEIGLSKKFTYIRNTGKLGPAGSRYQAYTRTFDHEICCMLDGDDWLYGDDVLNTLNTQYKAGYNCTYGRYINTKNVQIKKIPWRDYPDEIHRRKSYRSTVGKSFIASHMRTMQSKLIKSIDPDKYLKIDNKWIQVCTDMAEMFYVLENKQTKHKLIDKPIYIYNANNSQQYTTSWYRRDETSEIKAYRNKVMDFIKNV